MPNKDTAHYSIKHLFPLEIQSTHLGDYQDSSSTSTPQIVQGVEDCITNETESEIEDSTPTSRPQRKAAAAQRKWLQEDIQKGLL